MINIIHRITILTAVLIINTSCYQKVDNIDAFNTFFTDSIRDFLVLNQDDVELNLLIEISNDRSNFVNCLNCNDDELKYLNIEQVKELFFNNFKESGKKANFRYRIRINSVSNEYQCKYIVLDNDK